MPGFRLSVGDTARTPAQGVATEVFAIRAYPAREDMASLQYSTACGFQTHPSHGAANDPRQSSQRNRSEGDQGKSRENAHDLEQTRSKTGFGTIGERSGPRPTHHEKGSIMTVL